MRKWMNLVERQLQHNIEARGFYSGQQDLTLSITVDKKVVGYVDYSVFEGDVHIQMIKVLPEYRRQGLGREMLRMLQKEYPDTEINVGSTTEDGAKLVAAMNTRDIPNGDIAAKQAELQQVRNDIEALKQRHDDLMDRVDDPDFDTLRKQFIDEVGDSWSELYDREYQLMQEIGDQAPTKRIFEGDFPLLEKYTASNSYLLQYLQNDEFDPYQSWWAVTQHLADAWNEEVREIVNANIKKMMYIEELGEDWEYGALRDVDPEDIWKLLPDSIKSDVAENVTSYLKQHDPAEAPSTVYFDVRNKRLLPRTTWLIHFTNDPWGIRGSGFTHGTEDMQRLGLTTHFTKDAKKAGGYNFAYRALSRDALRGEVYGKHAVMFQSSGVQTHHNTDNEEQIIFWGPDVKPKDIVVLVKEHGDWTVLGHGSGAAKPLVRKDGIEDACKWVIQNFAQYRNYF